MKPEPTESFPKPTIVTKPNVELEIVSTTICCGGKLEIFIEKGIVFFEKQNSSSYSTLSIPLAQWDSVVSAINKLRAIPTTYDDV